MIDIRLVEHFVLLMDCGTLTRAEAQSGVPKATLSRQITRLEGELGMQLFLRTSRRMVPTEAGKTYHQHARQLLDDLGANLEQARVAVQNLAEGITGDLHVLTSNYFSTSFVCQVVRAYAARHPQVVCHVQLVGERVPQLPDPMDCYVCTHLPEHANLVARRLGRLAYRLYASPRYLRQHGAPARPQELHRHQILWLDEPDADGAWHLMSAAGQFDFHPHRPTSTNDLWVLKTFAIDALGIALLPDYFAQPEVEAGALVPLLPDWRPKPLAVYCVYQKQRDVSKKLRAFIDLMTERFAHIGSQQYYVGRAG